GPDDALVVDERDRQGGQALGLDLFGDILLQRPDSGLVRFRRINAVSSAGGRKPSYQQQRKSHHDTLERRDVVSHHRTPGEGSRDTPADSTRFPGTRGKCSWSPCTARAAFCTLP